MPTVDSTIWADKHRPDTLSHVRGNEQTVDLLSQWVDDDSVPNLLFAGPAGTGKTASAVAFAKDKFGDAWQDHFLQLNASDDRGIDVVRNEIKQFARLSTVSDYQFKLIFLDESDSLTRDAQPALRRIMEDYSDRTRFILSCNFPSQIIDPIQSRCSVLRFEPLADAQMESMLEEVLLKEDVTAKHDQIEKIVSHADGDARTAVHTLQSAVVDGAVKDGAIEALTAFPAEEEVRELLNMAVQGDDECMARVDEMLNNGVDVSLLLEQFVDAVRETDELPADARMKMLDKIGECEYRVTHGSNPRVQMHSLLADIRVARHLSLRPYQEAHEGSR